MREISAHRVVQRFLQAKLYVNFVNAKVHPGTLAAAIYTLKNGGDFDDLRGDKLEEAIASDTDAKTAFDAATAFESATLKAPRVNESLLRATVELVKANRGLVSKNLKGEGYQTITSTIPVYVAFIRYQRAVRDSRKQPMLSEDREDIDQEIQRWHAVYAKMIEDESWDWSQTPEGQKAMAKMPATARSIYDSHKVYQAQAAYKTEVLPDKVIGNMPLMKLCAKAGALHMIQDNLLLNMNGGIKLSIEDAEKLIIPSDLKDTVDKAVDLCAKRVKGTYGAAQSLGYLLGYRAIFDMAVQGMAQARIKEYGEAIWNNVQHGKGVPCLLIQAKANV